jgi:hypothetical protein
VHDCRLDHTLAWVPELRGLPADLAREPWRLLDQSAADPARKIDVRPYRDSPLWFCAANRTNWNYEYYWLPGGAWLSSTRSKEEEAGAADLIPGLSYPVPVVRPLNLEVVLSKLPVRQYSWGDTAATERPHVRD